MLSTTSEPIPEAKITVIGKSQSGKSALFSRYVTETFSEPVKTIGKPFFLSDDILKSYLGASFAQKVASGGKRQIRLKIWDTAGDERYQGLLPLYLRGSQAVMICFSVCDRHSFEQMESFLKLAQKDCSSDPYILLIGTKCDTQKESDQYEKRQVGYDEAEAFARSHGLHYIETSAKENRNVTEAFELVGKEMLGRTDIELPEEASKKSKSSCSIF